MNISSVEIRSAVVDNIPQLKILRQEAALHEYELGFDKTIDTTWPLSNASSQQISEAIVSENYCLILAIIKSEIIGYLVGHLMESAPSKIKYYGAHLDGNFVLESYRSKGIGSQLCQYFISWLKDNNVERITVAVAVSVYNEAAKSLYRKLGFSESTIVLEKELN